MNNYSRGEMKASAKAALKGNWKTVIIAMLLAVFVPAVVLGVVDSIFTAFSSACTNAGAESTAGVIDTVSGLVSLGVTVLILGPLSMGFYFFCLRFMRGWEVNTTLPYRVFSKQHYTRLTLSFVMMEVFTFLWGLLFIIPGIVKYYAYSMTPYILMDHPEMGWKEAITASRMMMKGHKFELFVLDLSFILWMLFACITFGIGLLYVTPYMEMTTANFYRSLRGEEIIPKQNTAFYY